MLLGRVARPASVLAMLVIGCLAPVVRISSIYGWSRAAAVGSIALGGLALHVLCRDVSWMLRAVVAGAAGAAIVPLGGIQTGLWVALSITLATWTVLQRPPLPILPASHEATFPLVVLSLVAAWRERTTWGWPVFIVFAVLAVVAILVTSRWEGIAKRFGIAVRRGLSIALFAVLSIFTVIIPWAAFRVFRIDPFQESSPEGSNWSRLAARDLQPGRPWVWSSRRRRPLRERPWQQWAGVVAILAVIAAATWQTFYDRRGTDSIAYSLSDSEGTPVADEIPAAFAGDDWYPKYKQDIDYASRWLDLFLPFDGLGLPDFESRYFNTSHGVRRSWSPPECACRTLTVWIYGASTVLGLGQRDYHTIPSELARIAWKNDLRLDVANRGVPGEQHWQEANRLRWDLSREQSPDLVVFYDGASDTVGASWLNEQRLGDVDVPTQPLTEDFFKDPMVRAEIDEALRGGAEPPPPPANVRSVPPPTVPEMTPEQVGELAAARYETSRSMSRDLAEANDLSIAWFWQPTRLSRPHVDGEPMSDSDADARVTVETAAKLVDEGVIDLSNVLDHDLRPMFSDDVHHNEAAAQIIAAEIFEAVEPTLRRLAAEPS